MKETQISKYTKIYPIENYTFTFSKQHKLFNDNTQEVLNDISKLFIDKGEYCYLEYLKKYKINYK
jgi:hypothetical protein